MKRIVLLSILAALTFFVSGQTFIKDNKTWNVVECINWGVCGTQSFKISGDTVISQMDYKKLYATYDTTLSNWSAYGALRENENRVYFYLFANETEVLLYDFSLIAGESFISTHNSTEYQDCPIEMEVSLIDTVTIENGEQRQRIIFSDGEEWIGGIGSIYGLVYVGIYKCVFDTYYDLSCCHENEELIFHSPAFDDCMISTVGLNEDVSKINHSICPNPFTQSTVLSFNYSNSQTYQLQIFNSAGQLLKTINQINSGKIELSGEHLNSGLYFYQLINDQNEISYGKLIKK